MSIAGTVIDTVSKKPLQHSVAMAIRIKDSILVAHTRTNENGRFEFKNLNIDTLEVIVSNPQFGDQTYYVFGSQVNHEFDFGKIILPPKSQQLKEVVIYAFKDPVYYKGDTLVYTADSFKVKPNATVEDLLKKLPGIKVDAQGKITSQGKKVDQVLVDGDEFFGTDPTVATKNLNANTVESVQVYEKKAENTTSDNANETMQVMNLKLKDDAKKGYFGKVSGASDFQKFYEGELLANKFNNKQKISVFTLASNTPRSNFGWSDSYKYGLNEDMNSFSDDDGNTYWYNSNNQNGGIPQTLKSGIYYTDKLSKKTKLSFNYSYNTLQLNSTEEMANQYFLSDTTYKTTNKNSSYQKNENHSANISLNQTIDSLTELEVTSKFKYNPNTSSSVQLTKFLTNTDTLSHSTNIDNTSKGDSYSWNNKLKLTRKFKKTDRRLEVLYYYDMSNSTSKGTLKSNTIFYNSTNLDTAINQQKQNFSESQHHGASITYVEPLSKKIKLEFLGDFNYNDGIQDKKSFNFSNGDYSQKDNTYSNNFENIRMATRFGLKFIYEVKKQRFAFGSRLRRVSASNTNLISNQKISQTIDNILPYLSYRYKFSDNQTVNFEYYTSSDQPSLTQLQPVPDNTNPNQIKIGNPNLLPNFTNHFGLSFNSYKPISGKYVWANADFNSISDDFSNATFYDSIGRTNTKTINVNGNYDANGYIGAGIPMFSKLFELNPSVSGGTNSNTNYINGSKNITQLSTMQGSLDIAFDNDSVEFRIGGNYSYNVPFSTLNNKNNVPFSEQQYSASFAMKLPFKFRIETNASYNILSKRTQGYNTNYVLWNASLIKTFFKNEILIASIDATDMLNQNINNRRTIQDNVITDTKTNIIGRYILLKIIWKFNSNKKKDDDEMF